jgi:bacterioferritin-associated ferredoxin
MIVCQCGPVSDTTIRDAIRSGAHTADDVGDVCGAGVQCGTCRPLVERMVDEAMEQVGPAGRGSGSTHG